jgi:hypothetical protein
MSEMVERVAQKLYEAEGGLDYPKAKTLYWFSKYRGLARTAINAMRNPTEAMLEALVDNGMAGSTMDAVFAWSSVIDAALREDK